jgi:phenylpropionate dioxygenase-like ring-hydroxylating dioxygenase large terminal subunit
MLYPRNAWYVACSEDDLRDEIPYSARLLDEPIVIWRANGAIYALESRCVHRAASLSMGTCKGATLRCKYHGLLFNHLGKVIDIPGQDNIPSIASVRKYAVERRFGWVWLWMGEADSADRDLLPNLPADIAFENHVIGGGVLDYQVEARLVSDNLLDFGHLTYVHAESFQPGDLWLETPMRITPIERGVHAGRWVEGSSGPGWMELTVNVDEWIGYEYLVPGVLIMFGGHFPLGTARSSGYRRPDPALAIGQGAINIQAVSPTGPRSSRFYFLTGPHRRFGDEAMRDRMIHVNYQAFNEDKAVIEAQQKMLDHEPHRPVMPTIHDRGVIVYNHLVDNLVAEERDLAVRDRRLATA